MMKQLPKSTYIVPLLCALLLGMGMVSCRKAATKAVYSVDSTKVMVIMEMQKRGTVMRNNSDFESAIATHDSCIKLSEEIADTMQLIIALNNQGTNLRRIGSLNDASTLHYRALALCDAYSDTTSFEARKNRVRSLNGLGNIFMSIGDRDEAEATLRMALAGEVSLNSATGQAINLANIGSIKEDKGEDDSARYYFNRSMEKNREANNQVGISLCYTYLGNLDQKSNDTYSALNNFRKAFDVGRGTEDTWHWLNPCIKLAQIYTEMNTADSARKYIEIGISAASKINSHEHLMRLYSIRSLFEEQQNQTGLALRDLQMSHAFNDSMKKEESRDNIHNMRVNYVVNRSEIELKAAEEKASLDRVIRNMTIVSSAIILILIGVVFILYLRSTRARRRITEERELFYRSVTHQLRTPMTVVMGMVEQLREHIPEEDASGRESLLAAQRQSRNLLELIKKLIEASKEGTLDQHLRSIQGEITPANEAIEKATKHANKAIQLSSQIIAERHKMTILVAEDNDDVALLITNLLHENGYAAMRVSDGKDAWNALQGELPDLLITDIAMPRMDGLELMRHIRADETMSHLPIIVVSARVEDHERLEGISAGAEVYLAKPFIPEELLLRVKKILEQRELIRQRFKSITNVEEVSDEITENENQFINSINELIEKYMSSGDVNTTFLADKMCMSSSTLNRKMKNVTGMSVTVYVRTRRILAAMRLLRTTSKPISEIEQACGFNTPGHFSKLFKAETGMSPSDYRHSE